MTAGQQFVKILRPFGCILFLVMLVLFLLLAFLPSRGEVLDLGDYAVPEDLDMQDTEALCAELENAVFPLLPGEAECYTEKGRVHVVFDGAHFADCSKTVRHYFQDAGITYHRSAGADLHPQ